MKPLFQFIVYEKGLPYILLIVLIFFRKHMNFNLCILEKYEKG